MRLRVLVDPQEVRRAHAPQARKVAAGDAPSAALTGSTEVDGLGVQVRPTGRLAGLRGPVSRTRRLRTRAASRRLWPPHRAAISSGA